MKRSARKVHVDTKPGGRIEYVNGTFRGWSGHTADEMVGKRFSDFLTMAGRIYYETHIAPLLRMQGSFEEFAIDVIKADGQPLQMIANARERRDAQDKPLSIRLALIRATDRRRYEQELLGTRELAKAAGQIAEERLQREHEASELREQFIAVARPRSAQPARIHQRRRPHSRQNGPDRERTSGHRDDADHGHADGGADRRCARSRPRPAGRRHRSESRPSLTN